MSAIENDDPIFEPSELTYDCEEPQLVCERCGEPTGELFAASDCDPSVGYHNTLDVCESCRANGRSRCGSCA